MLVSANVAGSHWRPIFLINVPVAVAAVVACLLRMPTDERRVSRRIDMAGVATLTASMLLVVLPLVLGRPEGWPPWIWVYLAASGPAFAFFLLVQRRVAARGGAPLVNVTILARPPVGWALLALLTATGTYWALLFTLAQYLQQGLGYSLILTAGYAAISVTLFCGLHSEGLLTVLLAVGGLGLGINFSAIIAHLSTAVPPGYAPDISGVSSTTSVIGGTLGVVAFGALYFGLTAAGTERATRAFAVVTAAFAAAALVAALAARRATAR